MYDTRFTKTALKSLKKIQKEDQINIINKIEELANSTSAKTEVKKLKDSKHYRLRVGNYRILFDKDDTIKIIDIIDVLHRQNAYKRR